MSGLSRFVLGEEDNLIPNKNGYRYFYTTTLQVPVWVGLVRLAADRAGRLSEFNVLLSD